VAGSTCGIAAKLRRPRRDAGATGHNARERGTGESQPLPDRGQRLRRPNRDARPLSTQTRLPPVNAARANGGTRGGNKLVAIHVAGTSRIAAKRLLTGGADRVSVRLPDRGQAAMSRRRGQLATMPVNVTRANGGTRGREAAGRDPVASTCRIAARLRSQAVPIVWASGCRIATWRYVTHVATAVPQATTPVNAARANGGR